MQLYYSILSLLSLGLLLAASSGVRSSPAPVLDADGDSLERGRQYYAKLHIIGVPVVGLRLWPTNNSCPLHVDVSWWFGLHSQPLAFFPEDPAENIIREGNTLYAMFIEPTQCSESTVWQLGSNGTITTGGTTSSSPDPQKSRFAISKFGNEDEGYNFQYCPCSVGVNRPSCNAPCQQGLEVNSAREKLPLRLRGKVVNDFPTGFLFHKVKKDTNLAFLEA